MDHEWKPERHGAGFGKALHMRPAANGSAADDAEILLDAVREVSPVLHGEDAARHQGSGHRMAVDLRVTDPAGRPIAGAEVHLASSTCSANDLQRTDRHGRAILYVSRADATDQTRLVVDADGYWGVHLQAPTLVPATSELSCHNLIVLTPVTGAAMDSPCWGLEAMALDQAPICSVLGAPVVKVAVASCAALAGPGRGFRPLGMPPSAEDPLPADGSEKSMSLPSSDLHDPLSFRLASLIQAAAPGTDVRRLVLPRVPHASDVIRVIEHCVTSGVDVLCLNVAAPDLPLELEHALRAAREAGLVVLVPAGDQVGQVNPVAASGLVLGVAALGAARSVPACCPHHRLMDIKPGQVYAAMAGAARGHGIDLVAPGIAVRPGPGLVSGSCFAAAYASGFVARLICARPDLGRMHRSEARVEAVSQAVKESCVDAGLGGPLVQGAGLPVWASRGRLSEGPAWEQRMERLAQAAMARLASAL